MANLYSRYVPPKKKQKTDSASPQSILESKQTLALAEPVAHTKLDASSTYMRHVPSSKSKGQNSSQVHKRGKDETQSSSGNLNNAVLDDVDIATRGAKDESIEDSPGAFQNDAMDVDTPIKREKKRKKEKKPASEPEHFEGVDADGVSTEEGKRHTSILARREKSLQKAEKLAKKAAKKTSSENAGNVEEDIEMKEATELHSLEPLPQPEPVPISTSEPKFSALEPWMATPIKVGPTATASFSDLGIQETVISTLHASGFKNAFAVQAAVLPLLLPGPRQRPGDVLVSAATGSGKTLAYVLPMIDDISSTSITRLRGLIVVPTKELVLQAKEVCDTCANAFSDHKKHTKKHVEVGIAMGDQSLKKEQATLMNQEQRYDPINYEQQERRKWSQLCGELDAEVAGRFEEGFFSDLPDHVIHPTSKVDILICTPGRLVEHLKSTPGFTLQYLKWLVIDEADKLLDQSFQEWIERVMAHLPTPSRNVMDRVRKIVLSATMTSDVGQLSSLKLHRPKLVVLEGEKSDLEAGEDGKPLALPATLHEAAIKVHDDADKPLYLLELLRSHKMMDMDTQEDDDSSSTAYSSDDDSELDETSSSGEDSSDEQSVPRSASPKEKSPAVQSQPITKPWGVVIFTKSNENALRLSRLLTLIDPNFKDSVGTLTSETSNITRRKTLAAFQSGKISLLVASDLVSRGLDIPSLAHVVNYDIPSSLVSYVHRVGRTARAGKKGNAWTLFTNTEAAWFLNEIARSGLLDRNSRKVEMTKIDPKSFSDELRAQYEKALEELGQEARGQK